MATKFKGKDISIDFLTWEDLSKQATPLVGNIQTGLKSLI